MSFDSRHGGRNSRPATPALLPHAPRPSAAEWSILREDGIQWEGQVLLVGAGMDLPALLILTSTRLVMVANGEVALEAPRTWLRPEPKLLAGGTVGLAVTPHDRSSRPGETDRIAVKVRSGRADAARLVSAITGRVVSAREERNLELQHEPGAWKPAAGAATPIALPPLPDFDDDPVLARANRFWPPVEQEGVPQARAKRRLPEADAQATLSTWVANHDASTEAPARPATHRNPNWPTVPAGPQETRRQFNRGLVWGFRSLILALLVGTGVYFGQDRLPDNVQFQLPAALEDRFGLGDDPDPTDVSQLPAVNTGSDGGDQVLPTATTPSEDGTSGAPNGEVAGSDEGVGGNQGDITTVDPGIGDYAEETPSGELIPEDMGEEPAESTAPPAEEPAGTDSNEVVVGNGDPSEPAVTEAPVATEAPATQEPATQAPATEAPVTETPVTEAPATEAPATESPSTEAPATEAPATEVPATEIPATEMPSTEAPGTVEPTEVPGRQDETPTVAAPTEEPTPEATLESQPPSVNPSDPPAQEVTSGAFRYAITGADRGETIAALPNLAPVETGEWIVLSLSGENIAATEQVFDMSQFRLYADGQEVLLDVGNGWVSSQLGQTPAYGNTDAILWAGGEGHDFTLTFLAPKGAQSLALVVGDQSIDLTMSLETTELSAATAATAQPAPEALEATVVEVIDAETIVIEVNGIQQTVRYLGVDVPTGDDCFAAEARTANEALVAGQTIRLERQATDIDARGNWVRDVWVPTADGAWVLVSEALVSEGAASADISQPNTRFAAWLQASQATAEAEGVGMWADCDGDTAAGNDAPLAFRPAGLAFR